MKSKNTTTILYRYKSILLTRKKMNQQCANLERCSPMDQSQSDYACFLTYLRIIKSATLL